MNAPPPLTAAQRERARAKALQARHRRAEVRAELASGRLSVTEILERADHDDVCANLPVRELLLSLPGIGPARSAGIMITVGISRTRRVRGLGARQRAALLEALAHRVAAEDRQ